MSILGPCLRSNWTERRLVFCRAGGTQSRALLWVHDASLLLFLVGLLSSAPSFCSCTVSGFAEFIAPHGVLLRASLERA